MSSPDDDKGLPDKKVETSSSDEEKGLSDNDKEETEIVVGEALSGKQEEAKPKQEAKSSSSNTKWKYLVLGALLVCAIVVAITVPLVLRDDDNDDDDDDDDNKDATNQGGFASNITTFSVFHPEVPNFDTDILSGYRSEEEFAKGVTMGLQSVLDRAVGRNLGVEGYANLALGGGTRGGGMFNMAPTVDGGMEADEAASTSANKGVDDTVEDYGTNNQENGVEEGDVVVSNGSHLFAAYGDRVIVWNPASGDQVATIQLPEIPEASEGGFERGEEPQKDPPKEPEEEPNEKPDNTRRDSMWYGYYNMASVDSMILLDNKLVVFARGYGSQYYYSTEHVIDSYLATRVLVYDIGGLPTSAMEAAQEQARKPLATKDVNGYYVSARAIQGNVHLVTTTGIQLWERVIMPFEKNWDDELREMSNEEYVATVIQRANEDVIPEFVNLLKEDVKVDGKLPLFAKINTYDDGSGSNLSHRVYPNGYMDSIAFVYSFNVANMATVTSTSGPELTGVSAAGAVVPASNPIVYASGDTMIVATSGMGYSEEREAMLTKTYLMSFLISGASVQPYTIGSVFGEIINQYSMDVVNGVLRIATTIRRAWFWGVPEPILILDEETTTDVDTPGVAEETATANVDEEPDIREESTTENYIITLSIAGIDDDKNATTPAVMEQYDAYKIGKPNESITAVRFFDRYAYAVTFERTDPFYKLDVQDPRNITELAAVEITGFSQYLHPFDDSEEMIIALGQEADDQGRVLGLQISLFNMTQSQKPKVIRHNIEVDPNKWSSSEALWDPKAVRFNKKTGLLIIPVNLELSEPEKGYFNGFKIFSVTGTSITEHTDCSIDLAGSTQSESEKTETNVYYCAWLPPRAMIFEGSMVVMKEQWIARKDLGTEQCDTEWIKQVLVDDKEGMCGW